MVRWMIATSRNCLLAVAVVLGIYCGAAQAQSIQSDRATAEALFRDAKKLMGSKHWAEACRKLEESQKLDPRDGTLLNLAVCHEQEGKLATAWVEFQEALSQAISGNRPDRQAIAHKRIAVLEISVPRLTIEVGLSARVAGLAIRRNKVEIGAPAWGIALPVDPGPQLIEVSAPGYKAWVQRVTLAPMERRSIHLAALERDDSPVVPSVAAIPQDEVQPSPKRPSWHLSTPSYIAGGIGLLGLGVGGYFGWRAIDLRKQSDSECKNSGCTPRGIELNDDARRSANVSNVALGVGLVGIGLAGFFVLTSASEPSPALGKASRLNGSSPVAVLPVLGPRDAAIVLHGAW